MISRKLIQNRWGFSCKFYFIRERDMVKRIGLFITVVIIVLILLYIIPYRHKINTTLEGVQCRNGDGSYSENISITVQGNYFSYFFKDDRFEGKILVDKYDYTLDGSWVFPLRFIDGWAPLIYQNISKDGTPVHNALGSILLYTRFQTGLNLCTRTNRWRFERMGR
jgi:hypothetical protein